MKTVKGTQEDGSGKQVQHQTIITLPLIASFSKKLAETRTKRLDYSENMLI